MEALPPGFRFYPTEEELINFYLHNKLHGQQLPHLDRVIPSIDIYNFEPPQLPELAGQLCSGETEQWFFFMPQQEREARGGRPNRTTASGYWKATGSPSYVYSSQNKVIGVKKTMVFYKGKAPTGTKTKWKMNEYKAVKQDDNNTNNNNNNNILDTNNHASSSTNIPQLRNEMSICRVYITSGCARAFDRRPPGPSNDHGNNNVANTSNYNQPIGCANEAGPSQGGAIVGATNLMENSNDCSTDSSNSGGDHETLQQGQGGGGGGGIATGSNSNIDDDIDMMNEDMDVLLDWEQLGWL